MINNYNDLKTYLDEYYANLFTLSTYSTDSNKVNINFNTTTMIINLPISEIELDNNLTLLILKGIEKEFI